MPQKSYTLDELENEIYRLDMQGKNISEQLSNNLKYLEDHYTYLILRFISNRASIGKEKIKEKMKLVRWIFGRKNQ